MEATAQFEEDLQTLQASIDAEFGKDSDDSGKKLQSDLFCFVRSAVTRVRFAEASDVSEKDLPGGDLFCAACNKFFKSSNA